MNLNTLGTMSFKTKLNNPLQDPSLPHSQVMTERKDWNPCGNSALGNPSCLTIYSGLFFSSRIKGHLLEAPPAPGPGSLTASNLHIQFAFQDFPHRGPTVRIPKPSRGESLDVFLPWGGRRPMMGRRKPMMGGLHA